MQTPQKQKQKNKEKIITDIIKYSCKFFLKIKVFTYQIIFVLTFILNDHSLTAVAEPVQGGQDQVRGAGGQDRRVAPQAREGAQIQAER